MSLKSLFFSVMVVGLVAAGAFAAGSSENNSATSGVASIPAGKSSWQADTSPVTLSIYVDYPISYLPTLWGNDPVSKRWMQETGINFQWVVAPDTTHTKYNVLIASGSIPDLIYADQDLAQNRQLADNGALLPLDEAAPKYAPNLWQYLTKWNAQTMIHLRVLFDSMHIYMTPVYHMPSKYDSSPYQLRNATGLTVIDHLYQQAGSPKVKTADDYIALMSTIKKNNPNITPVESGRQPSPYVDGSPMLVADALPYAGLSQEFFQLNGKWVRYWEHPDFVKALEFVNALLTNNLASTYEFAAGKEELKARGFNGTIASELSQDSDNIDRWNDQLHKVHPDWNWIMIDPFTIDPSSMKWSQDTTHGGYGSAGLMVSAKTKYPARVTRFLDFLYDDNTQKEIYYGLEGQASVTKNGVPEFTPEAQKAISAGQETAQREFGIQAYYLFRDDYWQKVWRFTTASPIAQKAFQLSNSYYKDLSFYQGALSFPANSAELKAWSNVKDYYETEILKVITGKPSEVDARWNALLGKMKDLGLSTLDSYWTNYFNSKKATIDKYSAGL